MKEIDTNFEGCSCTVIHHDVVKKVKEKMPENNIINHVSEFFKVFGDQTRIKIIVALLESRMCVCDLACLLEMTQSAVSHQLRVLKQNRLVKYSKEGKVVYYSLDDEHIKNIFNEGMIHILEKI